MPDMPLLTRTRSAVSVPKDRSDNTQDGDQTNNDTLSPTRRPSVARPVSDYGYTRSRLSHEVQPQDVQTDDEGGGRANRFSMLKKFNLSESALAARAKEAEKKAKEIAPPMPAMPSAPSVPAILRTAPTMDHATPEEEVTEDEALEMQTRPSFFKRTISKGRSPDKRGSQKGLKSIEEKKGEKAKPRKSIEEKRGDKKSLRWRKLQGRSTGLDDLQRLASANVTNSPAPPSYGDESNSALALPVTGPRLSESTASEGSNASSDQIYGATTTTTHTVSTHTTFFRLPRRNKNRNSLFPLPVKIPPPAETPDELDEPSTPRASVSDAPVPVRTHSETPNGKNSAESALRRRHTESPSRQPRASPNATLAEQSLSFAAPGVGLMRNDSEQSRGSSPSSPLHLPQLGLRDRASTASSMGRNSYDMGTPPPLGVTGRNSSSTTGRSSFGALLNISRFRQSSEPHSPRRGSPGGRSKSNSFAMSREALVVPEREEGDTPGKYLERLESTVARSMIAGILSKSADPFAQAVLRSYTRRFAFFGQPIDMSLRKFLLEAELPKETQQVDRVIQAFADRYHECNPGIFMSPDQAYIIAFSLMMLHTDAFNKNNKRKMQKNDYIKNTSGQSVSEDILACFYDNICYTPFVHYEEEVDINGERVLPFKPKKSKLNRAITDSGKKPTGPVDPYNLLVEQKLELLRPAIKDSIMTDDPYNYRTSQTNFDPQYLQRAFTHTGVLQIISQRSRPTAYEGQFNNAEQPSLMEMQPGIIDIKITKVGTLWRKAAKKKKARSPWQEWGAVLTGSQLYLFKNAHWAKGLVHQFMAAQKHGHPRIPVVFKPPLQEFKPDALIKTDNAVALVDSTYNRHKNAITFVRPGGVEEVLLADNESELNDWLALINYAAAFRAAGVRIRGMVGGAEEDLRARELRRLESVQSARSVQTVDSLSVQRGVLSPQLQRQVMAARRQIMVQKISEAAREISETEKELENMLRNARHLLVLAPIAPRTRDDVIHAAARADASIKWTRRDIWRMKCHKDILATDILQDGVSAAEVEILAEQQAEASDSARKSIRSKGLHRLISKSSATRSPPQSPTATPQLERPATTGSLEGYISNDVFRAPPELVTQDTEGGEWRIPPLQLDVLREDQHRASVTSTLLSASSQGRLSVSNASTISSIRQVASDEPTDATSHGRSSSVEDAQAEKLARTTTSPERKGMNVDGATPTLTPESNKQKSGVRRSLQKTLRDSHHASGGSHRHKRGKESDSTVRSANTVESEDGQDGTPGLKRERGRFILHGKQASVIHFGNDWPDERMRARRAQWRESHASSSQLDRTPTQRYEDLGRNGYQLNGNGSVIHDLNGGEESQDESGSPPDSSGTMTSPAFKNDVQVAMSFAGAASPEGVSSTSEHELEHTAGESFALNGLHDIPNGKKRETVIGPKPRRPSSQEGEDVPVVSNEETDGLSESSRRKDKRRTVIGPMLQQDKSYESSVEAGAEDDGSATESLVEEIADRPRSVGST